MKQPDLVNEWGLPFYGRAENATGDLWWYTDDDGKRHALLPANPIAAGFPVPQPATQEKP